MELDYINIDKYRIGLYNQGPVGVGISGGADSALLLYILMSKIKTPLHIYNMMAEYRRPVLEHHFDQVVETCSKLTGNINFTVHKKYVEPDESVEFYIGMMTDALDSNEVDIVYLGLTKFPPKEVYMSWPGQQPDWHNSFRSDEVDHPLFGFKIPVDQADNFKTVPLSISGQPVDKLELDDRAYIPFFNYNKKDIARMYEILNLEKTLLPVTRSCENDKHPLSHCNECWWCRERIWAFGYTE